MKMPRFPRVPNGALSLAVLGAMAVLYGCGSRDDAAAPAVSATTTAPASAQATPDPGHAPPAPPASIAAPAAPDVESDLPEIIVRVGDEEITRDQYLDQTSQLQARLYMQKTGRAPVPHVTALPPLTEEQKATILNAMIEARIFGTLAEASDLTVTDEEVNTKVTELKNQLVTEGDLKRLLNESNLTEEKLRDNIRLRLLIEKYGESLVQNKEFTDGQLQQAYDRLKQQGALRQPQTADILQIFLPVDPEGPDPGGLKVQDEIRAIRERIVGGEEFQEVAKEVSKDAVSAPRGGLYETVRRGQMGQGFDDRLFTLPLNEVSEPFRSMKGWHIMKVLARHEPHELTFDDAKPALEKMLLAARRQEAMARKVAQVRPSFTIEKFINIDLDSRNDKPVMSIPADAVKNPNALPESARPPETSESTPASPSDETAAPEQH